MTHRLQLAGVGKRLEREHKERAWTAWHIAWMGRVKKPPSLAELIGEKPKRVAQSANQIRGIFAGMRAVAALEAKKKGAA